MNKNLILASILGLGLAASPGAMAKPDKHQGRDHGRGPDRAHQDHRAAGHQRDNGKHRGNSGHRGNDNHRDARDRDHDRDHYQNAWYGERERRWQGERHRVIAYQPPRGYVRHDWHYGDRVPVAYRSRRYVVDDYYVYRLEVPPRGYHWLRVDDDVVLTTITTGVIAAVVYGIFQ